MLNESRAQEHKRNTETEAVLTELTRLLSNPKINYKIGIDPNPLPNIYILGCARCGSTVLHQLLVKMLNLCYPTNLISRFYYAPYIGSLVQRLMSDLDSNDELLGNQNTINLTSELGKTNGALSPNEFWYFWRAHFTPNDDGYVDVQSENQLLAFQAGLNEIKRVFGKPLLLKGMIANNCISEIITPNSNDIVIHVKRKLAYNALSLFQARKKFFGDVSKWYSFKLPGHPEVANLTPHEQVVYQVVETNRLIENQLKKISPANVITLNYEDIAKEVNQLVEAIAVRTKAKIIDKVPSGFHVSNSAKQKNQDFLQIELAIKNHLNNLSNPYL